MHFENLLARWRYLDRSCFMKTMRYLHLKRTTFQVHCNDLRCNPKQIDSTVHGQQLKINYSSMIISTCIICGSIRHLRTVRSWKLWHCRSRKKTAVLSSYNRGKRFRPNFPIIDSLSNDVVYCLASENFEKTRNISMKYIRSGHTEKRRRNGSIQYTRRRPNQSARPP